MQAFQSSSLFWVLLGLAASLAHEKSREISIRKVIGASRSSIVNLLVGQFAYIAVAANLIALPVAYWLTSEWLESFSYRIDWPFEWLVVSFTVTFGITLSTVFFHVLKVSNLNPTHVLNRD